MEAGTAGSGLDLGGCAKDALNVLEDAIGLVEGAAGGHDVVENETAFVHLWEQVGAEVAVANIRPDHEDKTGDAQPKRAGERLVEQAAMIGEEALILGGNNSLPLGVTPTPTLAASASGGSRGGESPLEFGSTDVVFRFTEWQAGIG